MNYGIKAMTKEEIEAKARKMFPIGTKFFPAHRLNNLSEHEGEYCINTNNCFKWNDNELFITLDNGNYFTWDKDSKYGNTSLNRIVYYSTKKVFAKVLSIKQNNYELWD